MSEKTASEQLERIEMRLTALRLEVVCYARAQDVVRELEAISEAVHAVRKSIDPERSVRVKWAKEDLSACGRAALRKLREVADQ